MLPRTRPSRRLHRVIWRTPRPPVAMLPIPKPRTITYPLEQAAPIDPNAPAAANHAPCCGRQPSRRATSVTTALGSRLSLTICAFKSSGHCFATGASIHFDPRRQRSSYVVRMVVHCEHPLPKMTLLAALSRLRAKILKGHNATLTMYRTALRLSNPGWFSGHCAFVRALRNWEGVIL